MARKAALAMIMATWRPGTNPERPPATRGAEDGDADYPPDLAGGVDGS